MELGKTLADGATTFCLKTTVAILTTQPGSGATRRIGDGTGIGAIQSANWLAVAHRGLLDHRAQQALQVPKG